MNTIEQVIKGWLIPTIKQLVNIRIIRENSYFLDQTLLNNLLTVYRKQLAMLITLEKPLMGAQNLNAQSNDVQQSIRYIQELLPVTKEILAICLPLKGLEFYRFISRSL
ncbi:MAG: hypothetical protein JKY54_19400 [Flavobacteriales bacterium]|nr:hypothetical protein [Flavobacteriales bacterium]